MKKKRFSLLVFCFVLLCTHSYSNKLIGIDEGLSSRQVYSIEKGRKGFMWFLTHNGVDKYNGLTNTHYKLTNNNEEINASPDINFLSKDSKGNIIELSRNGYIFRYNYLKDYFELICDFTNLTRKNKQINASSIYLDSQDKIWINISDKQYLFDIKSMKMLPIENDINKEIVCMTEVSTNIYSLASTDHVYTAILSGNKLKVLSMRALSHFSMINYLYYHKNSKTLIVSTPFNGLYLYNTFTKDLINIPYKLTNIFLNKIVPYRDSKDEVLIATNGAGVYKLNIKTHALTEFVDEGISNENIKSDIIKDIYIDEQQKLWMAVYPFGIFVSSGHKSPFIRFSHSACSRNSLIDNQVNYIFEDSDKDIWFLTNNGISCYNKKKDKWTNLLYHNPNDIIENNHVFISMIEIAPREFIVSGYMAGVYYIDKQNMKATYRPIIDNTKHSPDKYIRSIYKDKDNIIWLGGYSYLKKFNTKTRQYKIFSINTPISYITAKNDNELWIGTYNGLYIFNKKNDKLYRFKYSLIIDYITTIYQYNNNITFIGTNGNGLFVYSNKTNKIKRFSENNSGLNSNYIYCIVPSNKGDILFSTEKGFSRFNIAQKQFTNWTSEQGLSLTNFNPNSGIKTSEGLYFFGGGNGFIMFDDSALIPTKIKNRMIFNSLYVNYQKVSTTDNNSPLKCNIDQTEILYLDDDQNTFSIDLASINFDNQSNIYYSWMIEGFYNEWTQPSSDGNIKFIHLPTGKYKLKVRSISIDDYKTLEERHMYIVVKAPFWESIYAQLAYLILIIVIAYYISRYIVIIKERNMSKDKIRFFINTAHDIRTPLSLIKAPLGEIARTEKLTQQGSRNINLALKNTEILTTLTNNLINFEKEELYSKSLNVSEYNLNEYINEGMKEFIPFAHKKSIHIEVHNQSDINMSVLIDKNKIDSILRNIIGNALKYTEANGIISLIISNDKKYWTIQISDTGIGISEKDQRKIFKSLFRSENATNMQISGSGIGMLLTHKLIKNHQGKINVFSCENVGTTFKISFPFKSRKYILSVKNSDKNDVPLQTVSNNKARVVDISDSSLRKCKKKYILIVEDNPELRSFLSQTLSYDYRVGEAVNGLEAMSLIKINNPDLIISDIMMPIMDGNELCEQIKENVETSHIPIILLTALSDKESIIRGLNTKADKYVTKPFDIQLLQATINNIFANREIIKKAFSKGNFNYIQDVDNQPGLDLDQEFLLKVTDNIKKNISKEINVDILCSYLNMSRSSFYNKIKALTDYSPSDYIRKIKMEEAARLLRTKNYTIAEVADMVGFGDPKYFTDIFKKYFNMPPSTYMKQN